MPPLAAPAPAKSMSPKASASRSRCAAARSRPSNTTATRASASRSMSASAARLCRDLRFLARRPARHRRRGAVDRPLHRPRPLRRPARSRTAGAGLPRPRSVPPVGPAGRGGHRTGARCEAAAFAVSPLDPQFRRAPVSRPAVAFHLRQQPRLHGRLRQLAPLPVCSVIAGEGDAMQRDDWYSTHARCRPMSWPSRGRSATTPRSARCRASARKIPTCEVPVLFEAPLAHRPDRQLRARGQRRQPVSQVILPARQPGQAGLFAADAHQRTPAPAAAWPAAPSTTTASPRATAKWSRTAC
jgi:hypothetical protein